jgi:hypothetical protein
VSPDELHEAWLSVLDDLEARVASPTSADVQWTPPTIGRIPRDLVGRASRLLAAQRDAEAAIAAAKTRVESHLAALDTIDAAKPPARSIYLDVTG